MYFKYFNNFNYNFENSPYEMCDIFSRPIINVNNPDTLRIGDDESPDQLSETLYDDNSLFYTILLLNNIRNRNDWPRNELNFSHFIETEYSGYSFHVLENPTQIISRGDLVVLNADIPLTSGGCTDPNDLDCFGTYGLVEKWDPTLKKVWVKKYSIGTVGAISDSEFFKQDNKIKIFKRNTFGTFESDSIQIDNADAFASDPNYTFAAGVFTMKRVTKYDISLDKFVYTLGSRETEINPYNLNISSANGNISKVVGTTYNSALGNTGCSVIDAYILSAGGQTGPDTYPGAYRISSMVTIKNETDEIDQQNEDLRYIKALKKSIVGSVPEELKRAFND